jgi:general nucleoside transport system permease protein
MKGSKWTLSRVLLAVAAPALAMGIALGVSSAVLVASGYQPLDVFGSMWSFGTQLNSIISMVNRAVPYYLAGLAVAVGFKMNLFNIGVEGQFYFAALVAAIVGSAFALPSVLHVLVILLVAMAAGAFLAAIAGVLKATRGVNEVIATIMLNNIILGGFGAWMLTRARFEDGSASLQIATKPIADSGRIPNLNGLLEAIGIDVPAGARLTGFLLVAVLVGVAYYVVIWRTRFGYDLRASGLNPWAAGSSGVNAKGMVVKAMVVSGGLAGLVGMSQLLVEKGRFAGDFPTGIGFTGIAVALVGRNHPIGIALAAALWGFMERSAQRLDLDGVPKEIVVIMQGTIVLSVVVAYEVVRRVRAAQQQRDVSAQVDDERVAETTAGATT